MNFVINSLIWRDRGWSDNKGISANYKGSILVQWHETPHAELEVTSLFWYLISGSKFLLENCGKCVSYMFQISCRSISWCRERNVTWSHSVFILNRPFFESSRRVNILHTFLTFHVQSLWRITESKIITEMFAHLSFLNIWITYLYWGNLWHRI